MDQLKWSALHKAYDGRAPRSESNRKKVWQGHGPELAEGSKGRGRSCSAKGRRPSVDAAGKGRSRSPGRAPWVARTVGHQTESKNVMRQPTLPENFVPDAPDKMPVRAQGTHDAEALCAFEEASMIIRGRNSESKDNLVRAWQLLELLPSVVGVTAPTGSNGAGYALMHTCLCRNTPDWFMTYIMSRTPLVVLIGTQLEKSASGTRFKHVPMGRCRFGLRLSSDSRVTGSDPLP